VEGVTDGAAGGSIGCTVTVLLSVAPAWGGSGVEPLFIGWAGGATGSGATDAPRVTPIWGGTPGGTRSSPAQPAARRTKRSPTMSAADIKATAQRRQT